MGQTLLGGIGMTTQRAAELTERVADLMEDNDVATFSGVLKGIAETPGVSLLDAAYIGGVAQYVRERGNIIQLRAEALHLREED